MSRQPGFSLSEDHKRKIAEAHVGKTHSEETKRRISDIQKGKVISIETRKKMSESRKGKKLSPEAREKLRQANIGRKISEETRRKLSESHKGKYGQKGSNWQGGLTSLAQSVRNSVRYLQWRQDCFLKDNFACQGCGDNRGGNLEVHHKKSFNKLLKEALKYLPLLYPLEAVIAYTPMWNTANGITLCVACHRKAHRRH